MKKILAMILMTALIATSLIATPLYAQEEDVSESGVIDVVEPEPTLNYVFREVNLSKLSKFIDLRNELNAAKNVLIQAAIDISKAKAKVQKKFTEVAVQLDGVTITKFQNRFAEVEQINASIDTLIEELNNDWNDYNA